MAGGSAGSTDANNNGVDGGMQADGGMVAGDGGDSGATTGINPVATMPSLVSVSSGHTFLEGVAWFPQPGILLFSDVTANRINRLTPPSTVDLYRNVTRPNGNALGPEGLVYTCEQGARRIVRGAPGEAVVTVTDTFQMKPYNSPNDIVVRADGNVYFTDPNRPDLESSQGVDGVYRISPSGTVTRADAFPRPNGISLSPDEATLYVTNVEEDLIRQYPVDAAGVVGSGTVFVEGTGDRPDGMTIDDDGNLYVAVVPGIEVFSAAGTKLGIIPVAQRPTNVAFGGPARKTLYITAGSILYRAEMPIAGRAD